MVRILDLFMLIVFLKKKIKKLGKIINFVFNDYFLYWR